MNFKRIRQKNGKYTLIWTIRPNSSKKDKKLFEEMKKFIFNRAKIKAGD